ncbi:hypothetical protein DFH09DRAFT_307824 [Mycena vulgaris]|nr:hypothetical protein DFH09DRAFT_307824 [Mycena vulgaris]
MLVTVLSFLLPLPLTYAATNIIYSSDPSIEYSSGWTQEYSESTDDLYMQTDDFSASFTATLPSSASSVTYVGYKRPGGSMYGYCIDCAGAAESMLQTVNGTDPSVTSISTEPESTMFSVDLDPSTQHTLTVYNLPNNQLNSSSEINLDHLSVLVEDNDTATLTGPGDVTPSASDITASATSSSSSSQSSANSTPSPSTPSSATTGTSTGSSTASSGAVDPPATSTNLILPAATTTPSPAASGTANPTSSSGATAQATSGVSKSLVTGISILAVVFAASVIVGLVVFIRQRREKKRNSFPASQFPGSPTGSIIPIMPPPQMRTASLNPFSDPPPSQTFPERPLDSPLNSSLMQRRMESRTASPGSAPTIPLPALPSDRNRMETRSNSPASTSTRNDLWITRTPVKSQFSAI